jgi:hypothetical protein
MVLADFSGLVSQYAPTVGNTVGNTKVSIQG